MNFLDDYDDHYGSNLYETRKTTGRAFGFQKYFGTPNIQRVRMENLYRARIYKRMERKENCNTYKDGTIVYSLFKQMGIQSL